MVCVSHGGLQILCHGRSTKKRYSNRRSDSASLPSGGIQSKFEEADADVLLLYDCCNSAASTTSSTFRGHKGVTEVIAACGYETIAPEVGEHSFSHTLIEVLAAASKEFPISVAEVHARVLTRLKCWTPSFLKNKKTGKFKEDQVGRLEHELQRRRTPIYGILCETEPRRSIAIGRMPLRPNHQMGPRYDSKSAAANQSTEELKASTTTWASDASSGKRKMIPSEDRDCHPKRLRLLEASERYPQIILAIRLEKEDFNIQSWKECLLRQLPSEAQDIKIEGIYGSFSTLLLLRIPVVIWDLLPPNPAYSFVGFVTTENLAVTSPQEQLSGCHCSQNCNKFDIEPSSHFPLDSISRQSEPPLLLTCPDMSEEPRAEVPSHHGEFEAENMIWSPSEPNDSQREGNDSRLMPHTKALEIKTPKNFPPPVPGNGLEDREAEGEAEGDIDMDCIVAEEASDTEYTPKSTRSRKRTAAFAPVAKRVHTFKTITKTKGLFTCKSCIHASFKDAAALQRHTASTHTRAYICVFAFAGCSSTFASKNEWKRHVSSQHLNLNTWVCELQACGKIQHKNGNATIKGSEFNRKDLFTQHLRRMHAPFTVKRMQKKNPEWEETLKELQTSCLRIKRQAPTTLRCPLPSCDALFEGACCWDDRMEHVGKHLEKAAASVGASRWEVRQENDELFVAWALREGVIKVRPGTKGYRLCVGGSSLEIEDSEGEEE
jgi:hypothetical protein